MVVAAVAVEGVGVMATLIMDMVAVTTAMVAGEVTDGKLLECPFSRVLLVLVSLTGQLDAQSVPSCPLF